MRAIAGRAEPAAPASRPSRVAPAAPGAATDAMRNDGGEAEIEELWRLRNQLEAAENRAEAAEQARAKARN